ncbi:hypothetical protein D3C87_1965630 [compost metagenome]
MASRNQALEFSPLSPSHSGRPVSSRSFRTVAIEASSLTFQYLWNDRAMLSSQTAGMPL